MEMVELDVVREMRRASGVPSYRPGCMVSSFKSMVFTYTTSHMRWFLNSYTVRSSALRSVCKVMGWAIIDCAFIM